jgi:hypothetical protein
MFARERVHYRNLAVGAAAALGGRDRGRRQLARAVLAGYLDGIRGVTGPSVRY